MDTKRFLIILMAILSFSVILGFAGSIYGVTYTDYAHAAWKIADGKNSDLKGTTIGNGSIADVYCIQNCSGKYNSTNVGTETNASNLTIGTLASARLSATLTGKNVTGQNIGNIVYADQYTTIQDAINSSTGIVFIPAGTYNTGCLNIPNNTDVYGIRGRTFLNGTCNSLIPGNSIYTATIRNSNYNGLAYNLNKNISIHDLTIIPRNNSDVGVAFGGVTNWKIYNIDVLLNTGRGYKAIDYEATNQGELSSFYVDNPSTSQINYYTYGVGSGLAGVSSYLKNINVNVHEGTLLNITGDSLMANSGDYNHNFYNNYVRPGNNTAVGQFDAFVDIEGQSNQGAVSKVYSNHFVTNGDATTAPNGILLGGNGYVITDVQIFDNIVDNTACSNNNLCQINGLGVPGANISNGIIRVERNTWLSVGTVANTATSNATWLMYIDNYYVGMVAGNQFFSGFNQNMNLTVTGNIVRTGNLNAPTGNKAYVHRNFNTTQWYE